MFVILVLLFCASIKPLAEAANILYVVPFTSKSHFILLQPIGLELAKRGHNVTVITPYKVIDHPPNYHQVLADNTTIWEATGTGRPNVFTTVDMSAEHFHHQILWGGGLASTEISLKSKEVQDFFHKDNKFDLVINEQFYQEAFYVLAHKYNCPSVLITSFGNCMHHNAVVRNPLQLATAIPEFLDLKEPKSFLGRLRILYFTAYEYLWWRFWYLEKQNELWKKYIPNVPEPVPSLIELQRNVSLFLMNGHFSVDTPLAYLPNAIEIAGFHLKESEKQLPSDLQKILDSATNGVIYINFGSNLRSTELPTEKKNAFLNVFRKFKQTVLWKWEDDNLENKPDNVVIRKWLPQKEILAHPNVKVFVAHGGLIGMQEAIFHGVPVIGVPIYADQYNNLLQTQDLGIGKILTYHDINEVNVYNVLNEVLKDRVYKDKAEEISRRFKDRPMSALDTAMFWIEYVIRNKGADFMKNPAIQMSWIEYNMLDVYAFVLALLLTGVLFIYKLLAIVKSTCSTKTRKINAKNNAKKYK